MASADWPALKPKTPFGQVSLCVFLRRAGVGQALALARVALLRPAPSAAPSAAASNSWLEYSRLPIALPLLPSHCPPIARPLGLRAVVGLSTHSMQACIVACQLTVCVHACTPPLARIDAGAGGGRKAAGTKRRRQ